MCLWLLLVLTPAQAVIGDFHGLNTLEYQPTKLAAMEGNWETMQGAPLLLFAWPDRDRQENLFEIGIPYGASLILTHELDGEVPGISESLPEEQPPVWIVFWAFRIMVAIGFVMIGVALAGLYLRRGGKIYRSRRFLQTLRVMSITPFIAVLAGWIVTETGRAPWLIYETMTHAEGVTPSLTGGMALFTLVGYMAVYGVIFYAGTYYLTRVIRYGMQAKDEGEQVDDFETPKRPFSATSTPFDDNPAKGGG